MSTTTKTITAPLAIIKVRGINNQLQTIGKMRNIRATENIRRGRIVGLGEMTPSEIPALEWTGTINVGKYAIPLRNGILESLARNFSSTADFVKNLLFNEGIDIHILMKIKKQDGTFGEETFCIMKNCQLTSEGLDISEGQIGGRDATFEYADPIVYPPTTPSTL